MLPQCSLRPRAISGCCGDRCPYGAKSREHGPMRAGDHPIHPAPGRDHQVTGESCSAAEHAGRTGVAGGGGQHVEDVGVCGGLAVPLHCGSNPARSLNAVVQGLQVRFACLSLRRARARAGNMTTKCESLSVWPTANSALPTKRIRERQVTPGSRPAAPGTPRRTSAPVTTASVRADPALLWN